MKILVLNCGSSSIKYKLFEMNDKSVLAQGGIEKIGLAGSFLKITLPNGEKKVIEEDIPEHTKGVQMIFDALTNAEYGALKSLEELDAVGHRMLHGGAKITKSSILTKEVLDIFESCNDLGPLHNPANLKGVNAVKALLPNIPQVGVFDTHSTRQCQTTLTCIHFHTSITRSMPSVATASTEHHTAMFHSVYASSLASRQKALRLSLATLVTVVLSLLL